MPNPDYLRAKKDLVEAQRVTRDGKQRKRKEPTDLALQVLANAIKKHPRRSRPEGAFDEPEPEWFPNEGDRQFWQEKHRIPRKRVFQPGETASPSVEPEKPAEPLGQEKQ